MDELFIDKIKNTISTQKGYILNYINARRSQKISHITCRRGIHISLDGTLYLGGFKNGKFNGQGVIKLPSKESFAGRFRDNMLNGYGIQKQASIKYHGYFIDDQQSGKGNEIISAHNAIFSRDGNWFCGQFISGIQKVEYNKQKSYQMHEGIFQQILLIKGTKKHFTNNQLVKSEQGYYYLDSLTLGTQQHYEEVTCKIILEEEYDQFCIKFGITPVDPKQWIISDSKRKRTPYTAFAEIRYYTGDHYIGEVSNNQPYGYGKFKAASGYKYDGQYANYKREGYGKMESYAHGSKYDGFWHNDEQHGWGVECLPSGWIYKGQFHHGQSTGVGIIITDKFRVIGSFKNRKLNGALAMQYIDDSGILLQNYINNILIGPYLRIDQSGFIEGQIINDFDYSRIYKGRLMGEFQSLNK